MWTLDQINAYRDIIDVRSPAEYANDHVCNARNFPVLDNAERREIGLLYKASSFNAKKRGAAIVSGRIARYLEQHFHKQPEDWEPLVYCWRGGSRSAALTYILRQIGWPAEQLPGGYRSYRQAVIHTLNDIIPELRFIVLCGATGVGKSDLLQALEKAGEQVIDLEDLAAHRGSALGKSPDNPQPAQRMFESRLVKRLREFDRQKPVYIESESRRIGAIHLPDVLVKTMRAARCWKIEAGLEARVEYLQRAYKHFTENQRALGQALDLLIPFHGKKKVKFWMDLAKGGDISSMVTDLLLHHYDPAYLRAIRKHFIHYQKAPSIRLERIDARQLQAAQRQLVAAARATDTDSLSVHQQQS